MSIFNHDPKEGIIPESSVNLMSIFNHDPKEGIIFNLEPKDGIIPDRMMDKQKVRKDRRKDRMKDYHDRFEYERFNKKVRKDELTVVEFLKTFPSLKYKAPGSEKKAWVFWSNDDYHEIQQQQRQKIQQIGSQLLNSDTDDSFSAGDETRRKISDIIKDAFTRTDINVDKYGADSIIQFWAPVAGISNRLVFSTAGQPFAVSRASKRLFKYRLCCMEYQYGINDHNHFDDDPAKIISDAPTATEFLNQLPELVFFRNMEVASPLMNSALECQFSHSYMLPICSHSETTSNCIGVLEFSIGRSILSYEIINTMIEALKQMGLGVFQIQERIPYQIIPGLRHTRDELEEALKIVCESKNTLLAQVWISFKDDKHVSMLSYLEGTRKKQLLPLKLTGHLDDCSRYSDEYYFKLYDIFPLEKGEDFVEKTLEDYKPRFCSDVSVLSDDTLAKQLLDVGVARLAICLNSRRTGDFCYAFEFIWRGLPNSDVEVVERLLLNIKMWLPNFKLASRVELGDELDLINVGDSTATETKFLKIFQGKRLSPIPEVLEEERIPIPVAPLEAKYKTTPIPLSREVIEQFGNTEIEAAQNLKGVEPVEVDVQNSKTSENEFAKTMNVIPQWALLSAGKMNVNYMAGSSEGTCTTLTLLSEESVKLPFGNTIEEVTQKEPESDVADVEINFLAENMLPLDIALERGEALERGREPLERKYKTAPIALSKEAIENQYGNTMKKAAQNLKVSISTLKRKCKDIGIEWQGPITAKKRKANESSNLSEDTLTIKAKYLDDMIKFHLCISEATFVNVEEEVGKMFKLTHGTYKLNYLDEDDDWILLASEQDMTDCMKSSRNLGQIVVRLRVLPST